MKLTGQDIHNAYRKVNHDNAPSWDELSQLAQMAYDDVADELNKMLEQDVVTIDAIKCPTCGAMLTDLKGHPCL